MDIKVGDYVRTRNCKNLASLIGKVTSIDDDMLHLDCFEQCQVILADDIISHSKDLIDLIKVGDIVNNHYIFDKGDTSYEKILYAESRENYDDYLCLRNYDIKTILTKEQYEQNCYKVEE